MEGDVLFWTFLIGLCLALNGGCIFLLLARQGQYRDPEKAKFVMYEREEKDDRLLSKNLADV